MSHESTELFMMIDSMGKSLNNELKRKFVLIDIDSSDDEFDYEFINRLRGNRVKPFRVQDFISQTIPNFTHKQFQQHFRLSPTSFERCLQICAPLLKKTCVEGRKGSDERLQLLSVIWLLATPDSFRSVSDRFDVGKSSLHDSFVRVTTVLHRLSPTIINWPEIEQMNQIQLNFGVCDDKLRFIDAFAGYPGSVGDRRVFTNSLIYERILQNKNRYVPGQYFIAADKAYPILEWCIPPYIDRGTLSEQEKFFNVSLSRARQSIERCFALLKGRFRRLKYLDMKKIELIPQTIIACCVLHNICLQFDDNQWMNNLISEQQPNIGDDNITAEQLTSYIENTQSGCMKRDQIMLWQLWIKYYPSITINKSMLFMESVFLFFTLGMTLVSSLSQIVAISSTIRFPANVTEPEGSYL
ncbi:unnamed protein product [Macrosiphum euphorbiae]|uniref:DDE Tnp4 domain-containing protein n=1 Tax=Macrosiphum euphorbiae TaxID=13131 RepID=A0AAV0WDP7_9HEMI|nr:unnamed protein product [Macrosiphum euphorbiae]